MATTLMAEARSQILRLIAELQAQNERKLPTERELAGMVDASYATVRLVMSQLEAEGFIRKRRGSGTYIEAAAAELMRQSQLRRLWYFSAPMPEGRCKDIDYNWMMRSELVAAAAELDWKVETRQVRTHDEFLHGMRTLVKPGEGVIYLPPSESLTLPQLGALSRFDRHPLVVIDYDMGNLSLCNILTDNRRGGMLAARHLLANGPRNLSVLFCEPPLRQAQARVQGFCEIAEMAGVTAEIINCHVGVTDDRELLTYHRLREYWQSGGRTEGIFAISDNGAFGALRALREAGVVVGEDVSLIGFDGLPRGLTLDPKLCTIVQPCREICQAALQALQNWSPGRQSQLYFSPVFRAGDTLRSCENVDLLTAIR